MMSNTWNRAIGITRDTPTIALLIFSCTFSAQFFVIVCSLPSLAAQHTLAIFLDNILFALLALEKWPCTYQESALYSGQYVSLRLPARFSLSFCCLILRHHCGPTF